MRALAVLLLAPLALANGVLEAGGDVRLAAHRVSAVLRDRLADVTVEQVFENRSGRRLEGSYVFLLPDGASVSSFSMTMAGRMVEGEVLERGKARAIYEGIVRQKRDPGLLEQLDRGVFRARVFPIEADEPLTIRLAYQQLLPENDGTIELRYPLARDRMGAAGVDEVSFEAEIASTADLKAVWSPVAGVEVEREGARGARVRWTGGRGAQDRDFLLYVGRSPEAVGFSLLSHKPAAEDGTFLALFAPSARVPDGDALPKDVVYVLDTSGSMEGRKLEQAKQALAAGIARLRPRDRFGVVAFSSGVERFRKELVAADGEARAAATDWVARLRAGGGTALDEALQAALALTREGRLPIVALLTDGLPTVGERNGELIGKRVEKANRAAARIFVFGVGFDQDVPFLDRIALRTRGAREYVAPEDDLEIVVGRFFRRIDQPVLTDLRLEAGEGVTEVYPRQLPDLFAGDQLVVTGRYAKGGPRVLRLRGRLQGREITYEHEGALLEGPGVESLPRLWAQGKIAFLLDEIALHGPSDELRDEIVRLGTAHSIVTPFTAGLVVEDAELEEAAVPRGSPGAGAFANSAIGLGGGAGGGKRARSDRVFGIKAATDDPVEIGLRWLADHRDEGVEVTAWEILAFLGAGYTDRGSTADNPHAGTVRDGLRRLIQEQEDDGRLGQDLRTHAVATLALCEACWMTRNPRYQKPAQLALDWIADRRRTRGDWGADTVTTVQLVLALRSGDQAGLRADIDAFEAARRQLGRPEAVRSQADAGAALLGRILLGEERTSPALRALADRCRAEEPKDAASRYWATLGLFQAGREDWKAFRESLLRALGQDAAPEGPIQAAQRTLCLQACYRFGLHVR